MGLPEFPAGLSEEERRAAASAVPLRRLGSVDEVVAMVDFLLSPHDAQLIRDGGTGAGASYITGHTFVVDGGLSACSM